MKQKNSGNRMAMIAGLLTAIICWASPVPAVELVEGEWETVTEMVMEGMPFAVPPTTMTQCITKQDPVPGRDEKNNCTFSEQRVSGNTVRWKAVCKDKEATSEIAGEITYSGRSYKGATRVLVTDRKGKSSAMTMKLAGRYLGPCTGRGPTVNGIQLDAVKKQAREAEAAMERQQRAAEEQRLEEEKRARERAAAEAAARESAPGRDYSSGGRDYSARNRGETGKSVTDTVKKAVENPVKAIRGLFGF